MKHLRLLASVFALAFVTITAKAAVGDTFEDETTLLEYQIVTENQNDKTGTIKVIGYIRSYPLAYKWAWAEQSLYVYDDQFGDYCDIYPKELYPYEGDYPEWAVLTIPETITKNNITYTVTEIGDKALAREFANDRRDNFLFQINGPVKIIIPKTINKIGTGAFKYLVKLTSVEFSEQTNIEEIPEECFMQCSHLVTVKNISPIRIKRSAFNACSALQLDESFGTQNLTHIGPLAFCSAFVNNYSFYINSDNLIDIDTMAFERNHSKEIHVKHVSNIRYRAFEGYANKVFLPYEIDTIETSAFRAIPLSTVSPSIKLPDDEENILHFPNLKFFGSSVFYDNNKISSVFFDNPDTKLDKGALYSSYIRTVSFPQNIVEIPELCCYSCSKLKQVIFPNGLKKIKTLAFSHCETLEEISLPDGLTEIHDGAFSYCYQLNNVIIPNSVNKIYSSIFDSKNFGNHRILHEDILMGMQAPVDGKNSYPIGAFQSCINLKKIQLSENIDTITSKTFAYCRNLGDIIIIPNKVTCIEDYAFFDCENLRIVKIPNSVSSIGKDAFGQNYSNKHLTLPSHLTELKDSLLNKSINGTNHIQELTIPANVYSLYEVSSLGSTPELGMYFLGDKIPENLNTEYTSNDYDETFDFTTVNGKLIYPDNIYKHCFYVKKSVFDKYYPDGMFGKHHVSYKIGVKMVGANGDGVTYKTLCRDFDVDLTHTNDNLPEGVEPLRAYLVDDVESDLRMVFLNEIKYIPSRLKANVTDEDGNRYQGVDEYVGVVLRGTPGYTYYYEIGEHDYTQGAENQWLMDDAMAYSNSYFDQNLMAGDANDEFYIHKTIKDEEDNDIINYGLNNNRFKIYNKNGWLNYNKAYLQLPKDVSDVIEKVTDPDGNANLTFVFSNADGSTDKVSSIEFNHNCESDIFYNPYGQRVNANTKGIVINNGKKYVNK